MRVTFIVYALKPLPSVIAGGSLTTSCWSSTGLFSTLLMEFAIKVDWAPASVEHKPDFSVSLTVNRKIARASMKNRMANLLSIHSSICDFFTFIRFNAMVKKTIEKNLSLFSG